MNNSSVKPVMKNASQKYHTPNMIRYWLIIGVAWVAWVVAFLYILAGLANRLTPTNILGAAVLFYIGTSLRNGYQKTRQAGLPVFGRSPEISDFEVEDVIFPSRDGLLLKGWFTPPNHAHRGTILLTHGFNSNRYGILPVARLLAHYGYGLFIYDLRAHGESEGNLRSWGWLEVNDLLGALDYVTSRPEVDKNKIGAMGFSLGGSITIQAAAVDERISMVAVDGPPTAAMTDYSYPANERLRKILVLPWLWLSYQFHSLILGMRQPLGLKHDVKKISPRPVLIFSAGKGMEQQIARGLFEAVEEPKHYLDIPEAVHGGGLRARPDEYEETLHKFFKLM